MKIKIPYDKFIYSEAATQKSKALSTLVYVLQIFLAGPCIIGAVAGIFVSNGIIEFLAYIPMFIVVFFACYFLPEMVKLSCIKTVIDEKYEGEEAKGLKKEVTKETFKKIGINLGKSFVLCMLIVCVIACTVSLIKGFEGIKVLFILGIIIPLIVAILLIIRWKRNSTEYYFD